jgi:methylenetetrahydrofolate reductase (NADPH)
VSVAPDFGAKILAITERYSLEVTAKDLAALQDAAPLIPAGTALSIPFLSDEEPGRRIAAVFAARQMGLEPMPHFSARRIASQADFQGYLRGVIEEAQVTRCFIVAGDPPAALGPYSDTMSLIQTGAFENAGIKTIGIGGHPEGHPIMSNDECWAVLTAKVQEIERRGMSALIVTQFGFDPDRVLAWLKDLRQRGIDTPVRIGIPGPASIRLLLRFAARCGVGASAAVMKKYGSSITNLLGSAGPDKLVDRFAEALGPQHGKVRLHFYPFGGLVKTVEWINNYEARSTTI